MYSYAPKGSALSHSLALNGQLRNEESQEIYHLSIVWYKCKSYGRAGLITKDLKIEGERVGGTLNKER